MMLQQMRDIPLFEHFSEDQLEHLSGLGTEMEMDAGGIVLREGAPAGGLYVLLEGEMEIVKRLAGQDILLATRGPGVFVGEISLLTNAPPMATVRLTKPSRLLKFEASLFREALDASPTLRLLLSTMVERLRNTETLVHQHEKLSALGKLAAGLAHELNNPASAGMRAATQLPEVFGVIQRLALKLNQFNLSTAQLESLMQFQNELSHFRSSSTSVDPLVQSDREEELTGWLESQEISDGWQFASTLVTAGVTVSTLEMLLNKVGPEAFPEVLTWLQSALQAETLLRTLQESTTRIFELIRTVKAYSYMDQTPQQDVDVHDGLENTLAILGFKLKNIAVHRDYDHSLPRISVYGSELNQVWTNLIDNAIDALDGTTDPQNLDSHLA